MGNNMTLEHYYSKNKTHRYMDAVAYDIVISDYLESLSLKGRNVLEIGPGYGRYTYALSLSGAKIIASEPNSHMYSILRDNFEESENIICIKKRPPRTTGRKIRRKNRFHLSFSCSPSPAGR
jgi:predicted RNA methylase